MILLILSWLILLPVIYKKSVVGLMYVSLILIHHYGTNLLTDTEDIHIVALTAGVFSWVSMEFCLYLRKNPLDDVAYYLFILSLFALAINIVTLIMWYKHYDLEILNPIFAGISILSIGAIIGGSNGQRSLVGVIDSSDFIDSRTYNIMQMVRVKKD